jgi:hypothetical protein
MEKDFVPSELGPIDAVDLVALDATPRSPFDYIRGGAKRQVRLTHEDADRIADLFRHLSPSEGARCHLPSFGVRFWYAGDRVAEFSLCWECDNAYGYAKGRSVSFAFDSRSFRAVDLLMQFQNVFGK